MWNTCYYFVLTRLNLDHVLIFRINGVKHDTHVLVAGSPGCREGST